MLLILFRMHKQQNYTTATADIYGIKFLRLQFRTNSNSADPRADVAQQQTK